MKYRFNDTRKLDEVKGDGSPEGVQEKEVIEGEIVEDTVSDDVLSMWNEFADDEDEDLVDGDKEQEVVEEEAPAPVAQKEEVTPPSSEAEEEEKPAQTPADEVETEEAKPQPEVEKPKVPSQDEVIADIKQKRQTAMENIKEHFKLSEEQSTKLLTSPQEVLPDIMAKLYMDVYDSVVYGMMQQMPGIVQSVNIQSQQEAAGRKMFYDAWPKLDPVKHGEVIGKYAKMYVGMHPDATAEDVIRDVGTQVMFALKIPVDAPAQQEQQQAPKQPSFRPAGGGRQAGGPGTSDNIFTQMAEEDDFD